MTHTNNIIKISFSTIFAIFLLIAISISSSSIFVERKQHYSRGAESSEIAYSSALLGGFKGVIADILWLRITELQTNYQILELLELSELVTQLQPHIPEVWTYHAWNLSYNISIYASNKEDKWTWVKNGFELLRDKGLEINPGDPIIALELAWIFQHKIGTKDVDINGEYFRTQWVKDIAQYLEADGGIPNTSTIMAKELEQQFKLDTTIMQEIENEFGTIDWRAPYSYALYWSWIAKKSNNKKQNLKSTRMIYTSAVKLTLEEGKIIGNPLDENWTYKAVPNYSLIENTHNYIYKNIYNYDVFGIKHMFLGFTWASCSILENSENEEDKIIARNMYEKFKKPFSKYDFPEFSNFINDQMFIEQISDDIDNKKLTLGINK